MELYRKTLAGIGEVDYKAGEAAQLRIDNLTKPLGALGVLEKIGVQLACIQGNPMPTLGKKVVMTMAGDHGVVDEGVSAYPQEVTPQMVMNFLNQGAAINVLSNHAGAKVVVTDVGIVGEPIIHPELNMCKVRPGTRNMAKEAAMTEDEAIEAMEIGIRLVNKEIDEGATLVATGEMGIGNTTPSSAILACFGGGDIAAITGRGTGLDDRGLGIKHQVIKQALHINQPDAGNPLDVLSKVGGLEIAALTGVILGAAARRTPVVLDGFISTAAGLTAYKMNPLVRQYMLASHLSQEPGHRAMLDMMDLQPMLTLDLRLGEGTGAVLAFNLIEAAVKIMHEMATFAEAGVSNRE
ncbi:MAG: nicotinate-nucleotide--dimethylbenzimidazole phosphoribosyltransferase [Syntrophomonadaceae bacterium]|nr:nicotinate-nucleotide--dimethylbenzimidazole phosphoribosyltransferase [Syntrophomonadaceae bacterium]